MHDSGATHKNKKQNNAKNKNKNCTAQTKYFSL